MAAIEFLTRAGQMCTPQRREMMHISSVLGISALVGSLNYPVAGGATENSVLGPFYTDDAEDGKSTHVHNAPTLRHPQSSLAVRLHRKAKENTCMSRAES